MQKKSTLRDQQKFARPTLYSHPLRLNFSFISLSKSPVVLVAQDCAREIHSGEDRNSVLSVGLKRVGTQLKR